MVFAMISDKNILMDLNMWEKKHFTCSIWVFLKAAVSQKCVYIYHGSAMVRHDQRQEHPHEPQHVGEEASNFFFNIGVFKGSSLLDMCFLCVILWV